MTFGTIFGSVLGPSSSLFTHPATAGQSQKFLSERNSALYHHESSKHHKKSKSDKKHAILSALTLLAFLFFLSILQSCIREQSIINRGTVMMFAPTGSTGPTGHQAKDPGQNAEASEGTARTKRSAAWAPGNRTDHGRQSRTLLGVEEPSGQTGRRQVKFIKNFSAVNNWTRELSQISERELEDQKLKTLNFPLYWKNNRLRATLPPRAIDSPLRNQTVAQVLRRFRKRERTSSSTEPMQTETKAPTWDYKRPDNFHPSPYIPERPRNGSHHNDTQNAAWQTRREITTTPRLTLNTPTMANPVPTHSPINPSTTPRYRRSDHSTPRPSDYDDYDRYTDPIRDDAHTPPTSAVGLDLNTFQTFPVYNYYNHRPAPLRDNLTNELPASDSVPNDIDRMHNEVLTLTTQQPLFHPTKTSPHSYSHAHSKPPHLKHRNRHPPHNPHHQPTHYHFRNHHLVDTRFRFSPYRKTGLYDAPHFHDHPHDHLHDDYYPPVVLAKYEVQHDEPGFDLMKFLWAMVTSFAKPLTKLVPTFAKDNSDEPQCYDLLVCEAQRASRLMGPTAEALATTFGTLLTWAATEETRQIVVDAINSGRENTCQQQIRDCEERSGGKSAMTVIAQVMEMRLR